MNMWVSSFVYRLRFKCLCVSVRTLERTHTCVKCMDVWMCYIQTMYVDRSMHSHSTVAVQCCSAHVCFSLRFYHMLSGSRMSRCFYTTLNSIHCSYECFILSVILHDVWVCVCMRSCHGISFSFFLSLAGVERWNHTHTHCRFCTHNIIESICL